MAATQPCGNAISTSVPAFGALLIALGVKLRSWTRGKSGRGLGELAPTRRFIVVSTQGKGDEAALRAAASIDAEYHAFVGSRRKMAALRDKLIGEGIDASAIDRIKAPAGLDLGAITPEEIAMSILAEITVERRRGQRIPQQ